MTNAIARTRKQLREIPMVPKPAMKGKITKTKDRDAVEQKIIMEFIERRGRRPHGMGEWMRIRRQADLAVREAEGRDTGCWGYLKEERQ